MKNDPDQFVPGEDVTHLFEIAPDRGISLTVDFSMEEAEEVMTMAAESGEPLFAFIKNAILSQVRGAKSKKARRGASAQT